VDRGNALTKVAGQTGVVGVISAIRGFGHEWHRTAGGVARVASEYRGRRATYASLGGVTAHAVFLVLSVLAWISLVIWVVLLVGRGGFWRMNLRLPEAEAEADGGGSTWPAVTAVIPARDEAGILPSTLPSVLAQDYP